MMTGPTRVATVRGDGIQIRVAIWEGKGKDILCVHGLTANSRCWDLVASALVPMHRVIAMDLRGRGRSESPPSGYSIQHHCRDILALMDDLKLKRPVLMGHSLGAFISLAFAAQHPRRVDRVVLVDGGGKLSQDQMAKVLVGIKPSLDRLGQVFPDVPSYVSLLKQAPFLQPWNSYLERYYHYEIEDIAGGVRSRVQPGHIQEEVLNMRKFDISDYYAKVLCPVLILRATEGMLAEDDLLLPEEVAEGMVRSMPKARLVDLTGTNHYTILFHPNPARDRAVLDFLQETGSPSSQPMLEGLG